MNTMLGRYIPLKRNIEIQIPTHYSEVENENPQALKKLRIEQIKDQMKHSNLLDEAVDKDKTVLYKAKAVFPFDFFPNEIIIDMAKVTVIDRSFFLSGGVKSIYLRDIVDVEIEAGPLFSKLIIIDQYFTETKIGIRYLKKSEALKCRELIMSLVGAIKTNVDVSKLDSRVLINKMKYLARTKRPITP